jgi:hypothetical protein
LPSIHKIKGRDILNDIRSCMTDEELMEKYEMSFRALQSAFEQLLASGLITKKELRSRSIQGPDNVTTTVTRRLPRDYLMVQVPIYDVGRPEARGVIRDLTEEGIGIIGIEAGLDEMKTLAILTGIGRLADKIVIEAKCRWAKMDSERQYVCGFRITNITKENLEKLRRLIQELNWGG